MLVTNLQPSFVIPFFPNTRGIIFFIHNRGQMYSFKKDGTFGSFFFHKNIHDNSRMYTQSYRLERTHVKLLRTQNQECDDDENSVPNTTMCITRYLEKTAGCSMGMQGGDPHLERYNLIIHPRGHPFMISAKFLGF